MHVWPPPNISWDFIRGWTVFTAGAHYLASLSTEFDRCRKPKEREGRNLWPICEHVLSHARGPRSSSSLQAMVDWKEGLIRHLCWQSGSKSRLNILRCPLKHWKLSPFQYYSVKWGGVISAGRNIQYRAWRNRLSDIGKCQVSWTNPFICITNDHCTLEAGFSLN